MGFRLFRHTRKQIVNPLVDFVLTKNRLAHLNPDSNGPGSARKLCETGYTGLGYTSYGELASQEDGDEEGGGSYDVQRQAKSVTRRVSPQLRAKLCESGFTGLGWGHFQEVAALTPELQDYWLKKASNEGMGKRELRDEIKLAKQKEKEESAPKLKGDAMLIGEQEFGERASQKYDKDTVNDYARVASRVPAPLRRGALTYSHHKNVAERFPPTRRRVGLSFSHHEAVSPGKPVYRRKRGFCGTSGSAVMDVLSGGIDLDPAMRSLPDLALHW